MAESLRSLDFRWTWLQVHLLMLVLSNKKKGGNMGNQNIGSKSNNVISDHWGASSGGEGYRMKDCVEQKQSLEFTKKQSQGTAWSGPPTHNMCRAVFSNAALETWERESMEKIEKGGMKEKSVFVDQGGNIYQLSPSICQPGVQIAWHAGNALLRIAIHDLSADSKRRCFSSENRFAIQYCFSSRDR